MDTRLRTFRFGWVVAATASVIAQDAAAQASPAPSEPQVTVEAHRATLERRVQDFVTQITAGATDESFERWRRPICPSVAGLTQQQGEFVLMRLSQIAREVGAPLAPEHCEADLIVVVTPDPKQLIEAWRKRSEGQIFNGAAPMTVRHFAETPRPVRAWYNARVYDEHGVPLASANVVLSHTAGDAGNRVTVNSRANDTRIQLGTRNALAAVLLIVDAHSVEHLKIGQIADYLGMVGLAKLDTAAHPSGSPTILNLFAGADPQSEPTGLTAWDQAFLKALYHTDPGARLQRSAITRSVVQDIDSAGTRKIDSVDVYGTMRLNADSVWKTLRADFDELAQTISAQDFPRIQEQKAKIAGKLKAQGPFEYVALSPIIYYAPTPGLYVTIDVVEQKDAARRMPFRAPPTRVMPDPDGLLAAWYEYEAQVGALAAKRELPPWEGCPAPVLHCLASFDPPLLAPYLDRFNAGARANKTVLSEIATDDSDPKHRAAALYLLAHADDVSLLLPLLGRSIFDPDAMVRNGGMRILAGMATAGKDVDYPIQDIIAALDFPATTDRNKAAAIVSGLLQFQRYRDAVVAQALPTVIRLLKLQQPNNHAFAYEILKKASGKDYGEREYAKWEAWVARSRA